MAILRAFVGVWYIILNHVKKMDEKNKILPYFKFFRFLALCKVKIKNYQ